MGAQNGDAASRWVIAGTSVVGAGKSETGLQGFGVGAMSLRVYPFLDFSGKLNLF